MAYGILKVDTITFTNGGVDKSVPVSGLVQNPTFTGNVTVTGTISGNIIQGGTTVSGLTVTGTTANFASGVFTTQISGVTITGTTVSTTTGNFTSLTGTTATITSGIIASGTAALPSLAILSDPNTGIYSPGADQLAVATNGVERVEFGASEVVFNDGGTDYDFRVEGDTNANLLFVDASTDRVGVGTSAPGQLLEIKGANARFAVNSTTVADGGILLQGNGTTYAEIKLDASSGILDIAEKQSAGNITFSTGTTPTERLRVTSAGLVGIGTSSPITQLNNTGTTALGTVNWPTTDVGNASGRVLIGNEGILVIRKETVGAGSGAELYLGATSGAGSTTMGFVSLKGGTENASNRASFFSISTQNTVGSGAEAMRITSGGLVGIGTTSPAQALSVVGNIIADGSAASQYVASSKSGVTSTYLMTDANGGNIQTDGAWPIRFTTNSSERARIDSSGRLLVNTVSAVSGGGVNAQHSFSHSTSSQWAVGVQHTTAAGNSPFGLAIKYTAATPNSTSSEFLYCEDASALRLTVRSNGGIANFSANNANLSDRNVKKDISPAADTWDCIKEWEIVNYRYKDQSDDVDLNLGVIAQQVAESCPEVITIFQEAKEATKDQPAQEERLGVKEQQMYWMAIKALQEAQVRIEALEAEVAALKAQ